jgi:hypothetical protein
VSLASAANALWLAGSLSEAARFRRATRQVAVEQTRILLDLVRANAATEFGRLHGFSRITTVREYQDAVPLRSYDEYREYVDRAKEGSPNVLTHEPVRLFEPTSGSTSATKLIPYTRALQRQFQKGIQSWIADLFVRRPDLMHGHAYWSVGPAGAGRRVTTGGIPVGFDDDAEYVGGWRRTLVRAAMAAPSSLRHAKDIDTFQHETLLALVRSADLRIISVWNPTFLSLLVDQIPVRGEALVRELQPDRRRADVLRAALRARTAAERHAMLWPRLGLISCWADANAAGTAGVVEGMFPQAEVQPKGLIATEGFVSFPMMEREGALLAVRSHFLEFVPVDERGDVVDGRPRLAHELDCGRSYEVILSTAGGLYRYRLNDVIEVVGHVHECPCVKFVGRSGAVSDWFGEKLNDAHVGQVLRDELDAAGVHAAFAMLACDTTLAPPAYVLYIDTTDTAHGDETLLAVARRIDARLRDNFHYDYARRLEQLASIRIFRASAAAETYIAVAVRAGRRAGDVKPMALDRHDGWSGRFRSNAEC